MSRIFIVGAGGFGREVYAWLNQAKDFDPDWCFSGFIDDDLDALKGYDYPCGVVCDVASCEPQDSDLFVCGVGDVGYKRQMCEALLAKGAKFLTLVHSSVILGRNVTLEEGVVLCPGVILTCDIRVGKMTMFNCHSSAGHDVKVGAYTTVSGHCDLMGYVSVGSGVLLGSGARIIPGKSVDDDALVGAGAVVIRSVKAKQKVFGNPARVFG